MLSLFVFVDRFPFYSGFVGVRSDLWLDKPFCGVVIELVVTWN